MLLEEVPKKWPNSSDTSEQLAKGFAIVFVAFEKTFEHLRISEGVLGNYLRSLMNFVVNILFRVAINIVRILFFHSQATIQ